MIVAGGAAAVLVITTHSPFGEPGLPPAGGCPSCGLPPRWR